MTVCREVQESSLLFENLLFIRNKFNFVVKNKLWWLCREVLDSSMLHENLLYIEINLTLSKLALMTVCGEVHASLEFIVYWKSLTLSRKLALMTVCGEVQESSMLH